MHVIILVLLGSAVLDHGEHHLHVLLPLGELHGAGTALGPIQRQFRPLPKGIILLGVLWRGVFDEIVDEPEHI